MFAFPASLYRIEKRFSFSETAVLTVMHRVFGTMFILVAFIQESKGQCFKNKIEDTPGVTLVSCSAAALRVSSASPLIQGIVSIQLAHTH